MFKRYKPFFRTGVIDFLAYKFSVFSWLLVTIFEVAIVIFLWIAVYKNSSEGVNSIINGFTFKEMITYLVTISIFQFVVMDGETLWVINDEIKKGTISSAFIKPISYRLRFIATTLGSLCIRVLLFGIPLFVIAYIIFYLIDFIEIVSIGLFIVHLLLFIISIFIASLLNDVINYIFGVLCFYTSSGWGINFIKDVIIGFLSGTLLPLTFFPDAFKVIINYLPFAGMAYNPVMIVLMKFDLVESIKVILLSIFWLIILELFAKLLFNRASKKITVQGG